MLKTDLEIREDRLKTYRDPIGYCYAKWFDEPFVADILNSISFKNFKFILADDNEDRNHIDIYATNGVETLTIDCKIMTHNFSYNNGNENKNLNLSYDDILTIGEHVIRSSTDYILFVRRNEICICKLSDIRDKVKPLQIRENSKNMGGTSQTLINFRVSDLQNLFSTQIIKIPQDKADLYFDAYREYEKLRMRLRDVMLNRVLDNDKKNQIKLELLNELKNVLTGYILKYNNIYVEIPKIDDTDALLNDIYNL